jgi:hypothetical protein
MPDVTDLGKIHGTGGQLNPLFIRTGLSVNTATSEVVYPVINPKITLPAPTEIGGDAEIDGNVVCKNHTVQGTLHCTGSVNVDGSHTVNGDIAVTGDVKLINADCAEDFDIANADLVEPGTVMVLGDGGILLPSDSSYDKRVAGVISGAGDYKPGIVLDKQEDQPDRKPIALMGKVYCKVDASYASIATDDLLTTSPTLGHAMKATDPQKAFGAVIGKALRPLVEGQSLIPILIALQ